MYASKQNKETAATNNRIPRQKQNEGRSAGFTAHRPNSVYQRRENNTGLSDRLKTGVESLSGLDMSDVRVHRNSSKPATVNALAYTQGSDIHLAQGQEKHIAHEAWHAVQQKQGRVQATGEVGGMRLNDSKALESEADIMGRRAFHTHNVNHASMTHPSGINAPQPSLQGKFGDVIQTRGSTEIEADIDTTTDRMEGFSADVGGTRLTTFVQWETPTTVGGTVGGRHTDGEGMTASRLGPEHPKGSGPSGPARNATNWANSFNPGFGYIAGHLLNDNLGGTGADAKNLTAIPGEVNKNHSSKVEEAVKEAVNKFGNWVYYESKVEDRDTGSNLANKMKFTWGYLDNTATKITATEEDCTLEWDNKKKKVTNVGKAFTKPGKAKPGAARSGIKLKSESIPLTNKEEDYPGGKSRMVREFPALAHKIGNDFALYNDTDRIIILLISRYNTLVKSNFSIAESWEAAPGGHRSEAKNNWIIAQINRLAGKDNGEIHLRFPAPTGASANNIKTEIKRFSR